MPGQSMITVAQFQAAFAAVPTLSAEDLSDALKTAKIDVRVPAQKRRELLGHVNALLARYVHGHLLLAANKRSPAFDVAARLRRITRLSKKLDDALGQRDDSVAVAAWLAMCRLTGAHRSKVRDILGIDVHDLDRDDQIRRIVQRAPSKVARRTLVIDSPPDQEPLTRIRDAIRLLTEIAAHAADEQKAHVERRESMARHEADSEMDRLFYDLACLWKRFLGLDVTAGADPGTATARVTAPFPLFAYELLHAYAGQVPKELAGVLPHVRHSLRLSQAAIRRRVRVAIRHASAKGYISSQIGID